jgi:hypothetical protein
MPVFLYLLNRFLWATNMKLKYTLLRIIWSVFCLPLLLIFIPQALLLKHNTIRLSEAAGDPFGQTSSQSHNKPNSHGRIYCSGS